MTLYTWYTWPTERFIPAQMALWMLAVQFPEPKHTAFRFPNSRKPFLQVSRQAEPGDAVRFPQAGGDSEMFLKVVIGGQRTSGEGSTYTAMKPISAAASICSCWTCIYLMLRSFSTSLVLRGEIHIGRFQTDEKKISLQTNSKTNHSTATDPLRKVDQVNKLEPRLGVCGGK